MHVCQYGIAAASEIGDLTSTARGNTSGYTPVCCSSQGVMWVMARAASTANSTSRVTASLSPAFAWHFSFPAGSCRPPTHGPIAGSRLARPPGKIAERNAFADELDAKQHAKQPQCCHWGPHQEKKRDQNAYDAAEQDPSPVRERSYGQRENNLSEALNHKEHDQEKRQ